MRLPGVYARGLAMGVADVVPGVSGGTLALITGIYEQLITALAGLHPRLFSVWWREGFMAFWRAGQFGFLFSLLAGIVTSIVLFARLMGWLLAFYPVPVWAFFCGLIAASVWPVWHTLREHTRREYLMFVAGGVAAATISLLPGLGHISLHPVVFLLSGALAICAMILPGISGSFILLLLGMYVPVLEALRHGQWLNIAAFAGGCAMGLLSFVHLLRWLLRRWHDPIMALLAGFMAGSLVKLWPWRLTPELATREQWLWPSHYAELAGSAMVPQALLALVAGALVVAVLFRLDGQRR